MFYVSTTPGLRLQQKAEWVNINFERKDLNSLQKSQSLLSMILEKLDFSFALNLRKQKVTDFSFISLTHNLVLCLQITTDRRCKFFHIVSTMAYQTMTSPPPWYLAPPNSHTQTLIIPESIIMKCFRLLLEIKNQEVSLSISRHKGILNKHLCKNSF